MLIAALLRNVTSQLYFKPNKFINIATEFTYI